MRANVRVRVPILARSGVDQLYESHALLNHAARHNALPAETGGGPTLHAVQLQRCVGLLAKIQHLRHSHLHAERRLIRFDSRIQHRISGMFPRMLAVEFIEQTQFQLLQLSRRRAPVEIRNRLRTAGDARPGINARQKIRRPDLAPAIRH